MAITTESTVDDIPGTIHLVDLDHTMRARHAQGASQDIVLDPSPSNDPDDPLNWSPRRKLMSTICSNQSILILVHFFVRCAGIVGVSMRQHLFWVFCFVALYRAYFLL